MKNYTNIYFIVLVVFTSFFYFLNAYFNSQYDSLHFYEFFKKVEGGEVLYEDYIAWHGPYFIYFFKLLTLVGVSDYFNFVLLGFFLQLLAGYLAVLISKKIKIDTSVQNISFLITFISFSFFFGSFYWDYYAPLCGFWGLYFFFIKNDNKIGVFLITFTFFLKQSFGFFFILFSLIFCLFLKDKKKKFFLILFYFSISLIINLIIIFAITDFKKYLEYSIFFLISYYQNSYGLGLLGIFEMLLLQYIFLLPNIQTFTQLLLIFQNKNLGFWTFYIIFKLPIFFVYIYIIKNLKKINYSSIKIIIILLLGSLMVLPVLGRGFMLTTYYIPLLIFLFLNILNYRIIGNIYFLLLLLYNIVFFFNENKFSFNLENKMISKHSSFISFNDKQLKNLNINKISLEELVNFIETNNIKNIYTLDNKARVAVWFSNQKTLNKDLYFYAKSQPKYFSFDFFDELNNDIIKKKPNFIIYNNIEFIFFKNKVNNKTLEKYQIVYKNNEYTLLKKIND
jgi:hypothetical protein